MCSVERFFRLPLIDTLEEVWNWKILMAVGDEPFNISVNLAVAIVRVNMCWLSIF